MAKLHNYSIALFEYAKEETKLEIILKQVNKVLDIFQNNLDYLAIFSDLTTSKIQKQQWLNEAFKSWLEKGLFNFLSILIENHLIQKVNVILKEFVILAEKDLKIQRGIVYSVHKISEAKMKTLEEFCKQKTSLKTILKNEIDSNLIAGYKIVIGDIIIDNSIQSKLNNLELEILRKD